VLEEVAKRTFENDHGLMALVEELRNGKAVNDIQAGARTHWPENRLSVDHQAWDIERLIKQTADLRERASSGLQITYRSQVPASIEAISLSS
jgi:hypothetical protein